MRKLPSEQMCPVDQVLYNFAELVAPWFHKQGLTPNDITTLSFITGLMALFELSKGNYIHFTLLYSLSYTLDCLDGFVARKYNMTSVFGDLYDHITDILIQVGLLFTVIKFYHDKINARLILIYLFLVFLTAVHLGCQQCNCESTKKESLDMLKFLCPDKRLIRYTRFFGTGFFNVAVVVLVGYIVNY